MKARQHLSHSKLIEEVLSHTTGRFQAQIPLIKQCVETLIEKEYLARTNDGDYEYKA